nr:hypothetical protein B0A51_03721 [Rachicladosporium sp. CCFEE 5018]
MSQPRSPLLDLPPELRLRIYELLFQPQVCYLKVARTVYTRRKSTISATGRKEPVPEPMHLLRTCRLIYQEALPVFYSHTTFDIEIRSRDYGTSASCASGWRLCWLADLVISPQVRTVYLRVPPKFHRRSKQVTSFADLWKTLLRKLEQCKSLARVHIEICEESFNPESIEGRDWLRLKFLRRAGGLTMYVEELHEEDRVLTSTSDKLQMLAKHLRGSVAHHALHK